MQTGWRVGTLFNIPLFIDNSWFLIVFLLTLLYGNDPAIIEQMGSSGGAWGFGFAYAIALFGSVLLHELGHSLVAQSQGITVKSIKLFLFGGIASIERESKTPEGAFMVAVAGPAVSIILFTLLFTLSRTADLSGGLALIVSDVARINLVLALFNLIPGLPLDGGQIFKAAVWKATNSRSTGVRWAARSGQVVGWGGIGLGLFLSLSTGQLFLGLWPALIGIFILRNAGAYNRMNTLQEVLSKVKTGEAAIRDFRVLDAEMSLRQFADEYLLDDQALQQFSEESKTKSRNVAPVYFASSNGRYRGLVSVDSLRQVERSEWDHRDLHSIAKPLLDIPHVREETSLAEAIQLMEEKELARLTVLTPADSVAGTLDRGDVVRALAKHLKFPINDALIQRIKEEGAYPMGLQLGAIAQSIEKA